MENLVKEFLEILKNKSSDICSMYFRFFSILSEKDLKEKLEIWMSEYQDNKEDWFFYCHKSIRNSDFFDLDLYHHVNKLTEEQKNRRTEILKIRRKEYDEEYLILYPINTMDNYRLYNQRQYRIDSLKELSELNKIMRTEEKFEISGHLDMLLWNTIHLDKDNELQEILERTFKICG